MKREVLGCLVFLWQLDFLDFGGLVYSVGVSYEAVCFACREAN